jgi:TolB-like protein
VTFLFEDCALDTERREIRRGSVLVSAGPQVFDLLVYLVRNRHRVISKDDLLQAVWRGRIVSESTITNHVNAARKALGDSGDEQRLIRTLPRKGFRFVGEVQEKSPPAAASLSSVAKTAMIDDSLFPDRPSIAVLPFTNMSNDPTRDYFADGMTEDIITELSRVHWLFVIARNSTFIYKGRAVDVKQVGRELGVRYALEGSVRQAGDRLRITTQLLDAISGAHLWADRFDGGVQDVFDLQDLIATNVVNAIAPRLEKAEGERIKRKPTADLNAYDCFLRGMASFHHYSNEGTSEALCFFEKAIELDPDFAAAYGMAARCYSSRQANRWMSDAPAEIAEATRLARQAIELGRNDPFALCNGGWVLDFVARDPNSAVVFIDRARALNPNLASAWLAGGWARVHPGETEAAIIHFAQAMRLSPFDQLMFSMQTGTAFAHFFAGRNEEATTWAERALREKPNWLPALNIAAASNALAGREGRARTIMLHLRQVGPALRISNFKNLGYFERPEDLAKLEEGFRIAGLPE